MFNFISYTLFLCVLLLSSCTSPPDKKGQSNVEVFFPEKPWTGNVLVVSFDALRADALGVYGYQRNTSPNIDEFSENAVVFNQAFSAGGSTPTSFAAVFSGKWPFRSFVGHKMIKGNTLAGLFSQKGFRTGFISSNVQLVEKRGFGQGFDSYEITESNNDEKVLTKSIKLLEDFKNDKFFLWFHFISPHTPYDLRPISEHLCDPQYSGPYKNGSGRKFAYTNDEDLKRLRDLYDGEVFYADSLFQKILNTLNRLRLNEKTIIILTSDHGEEFMEHGDFRHNNLYEESIKIPFIIYHPDASKSGRTSVRYSNVDLMPTLAGIIKAEKVYTKELDGIDVLSLNPSPDRPLLAFYMTGENKLKSSIRKKIYKNLTYCEPVSQQFLFDLGQDPKEQINVLLSKQEVLNDLNRTMIDIMGGDSCEIIKNARRGVSVKDGMDAEQIKRLKSLGYVQ